MLQSCLLLVLVLQVTAGMVAHETRHLTETLSQTFIAGNEVAITEPAETTHIEETLPCAWCLASASHAAQLCCIAVFCFIPAQCLVLAQWALQTQPDKFVQIPFSVRDPPLTHV